MATAELSAADFQVKRVNLRGKERHGYYYRIRSPEKIRYSYYKVSGRNYFLKNKEMTIRRYNAVRAVRMIEKVKREEPKEYKAYQEGEETYTLHFRLDYGERQEARRNHKFFLKDSYITAKVPYGSSLTEVQHQLKGYFEDALKQEFNSSPNFLVHLVYDDKYAMDNGLEKGGQGEKVEINYAYAVGDRDWRHLSKSLKEVRENRSRKDEFLAKYRK